MKTDDFNLMLLIVLGANSVVLSSILSGGWEYYYMIFGVIALLVALIYRPYTEKKEIKSG